MIHIDSVRKELGEFSLRGISLQIERGEYFVILGPTGSGKTVLLECIAGLNRLDAGTIVIDGEDVSDLAPEARRIGYVPQDYVLFPHLTVADNIGFALRLRRWDKDKIAHRVQELAELLHISHLLRRRPRTLSGGEQQRSALARALAFSPRVLLLDEPLSALDEGTRAELSVELVRISSELHTTVIHVCHNFDEATDLADRIAIVRGGEVMQVGTPAEIFRRPCSRFVARFMRAENILPATAQASAEGQVAIVNIDGGPALQSRTMGVVGAALAMVRPEEVSVTATKPAVCDNIVPGRLTRVDDRGRYLRLYIEGRMSLVAIMTRQAFEAAGLKAGTEVFAGFGAETVHLLREE